MSSTPGRLVPAILKALIEVLNESGIPYCILHGYVGFPEQVTSDVDCLVSPAYLPRQLAILLSRNEERIGATLVQWLQHETTAHYFVLTSVDGRSPPEFLAFDVSSDYRARGRIFYGGDQILGQRRRSNDLWVPAAEMEFGYSLVKRVAKGSLGEAQELRLTELYAQNPSGADREISKFWGSTSSVQLSAAAERGDWRYVDNELPSLRKELMRPSGMAGLWNQVRYRAMDGLRLLRRWRAPTGTMVVLLGADGAGKSTVSKAIRAHLAPAFRKTAARHFGPDLLGRAERRGSSGADAPHDAAPRSYVASVAKCLYWLIDYTLGYHVTVRPALVHSTLLVFDRYLVDVLVDPKRYRFRGPRWLLRLVWLAVPKPDVVVLLDASATVLQSRKREVAPEESARQRDEYRALVAGLPNGHVVDATQSLTTVVGQVEQIVLAYLAARTAGRLGSRG